MLHLLHCQCNIMNELGLICIFLNFPLAVKDGDPDFTTCEVGGLNSHGDCVDLDGAQY